jgi:hypothetical protein
MNLKIMNGPEKDWKKDPVHKSPLYVSLVPPSWLIGTDHVVHKDGTKNLNPRLPRDPLYLITRKQALSMPKRRE